MKKRLLVTDQKAFFDQNAAKLRPAYHDSKIIKEYINRQQIDGLTWLIGCKSILDYGSGTGETIGLLRSLFPKIQFDIHAVDISPRSLHLSKSLYPGISIETISDNKIRLAKKGTYDGAMMVHVLHHSKGHGEIFLEINRVLKKGGKFMINDLTSNNPFVGMLRSMYAFIPSTIKSHFKDDLAIDEGIPEKYKISVSETLNSLKSAGFEITEVGYGHLFFFLFCWLDRLVNLTRYSIVKNIYSKLISLEYRLIAKTGLSKYCEVIYIYAIKK